MKENIKISSIKVLLKIIEDNLNNNLDNDEIIQSLGKGLIETISNTGEMQEYFWRDVWEDSNKEEYNKFLNAEKIIEMDE